MFIHFVDTVNVRFEGNPVRGSSRSTAGYPQKPVVGTIDSFVRVVTPRRDMGDEMDRVSQLQFEATQRLGFSECRLNERVSILLIKRDGSMQGMCGSGAVSA